MKNIQYLIYINNKIVTRIDKTSLRKIQRCFDAIYQKRSNLILTPFYPERSIYLIK